MPLQLDDYDVSILKSLLKDGRKSFREISRETGITTPTVKARFNRLVNVGFIKASSTEDITKNKRQYNNQQKHPQDIKYRIKKGIKIKLDCEFCKGPITGDPHVFRFANYERFFCCTSCMSGYKQKYAGRIESIKRKFGEKNNSRLYNAS